MMKIKWLRHREYFQSFWHKSERSYGTTCLSISSQIMLQSKVWKNDAFDFQSKWWKRECYGHPL